jgi:hypothetical protein
MRMSADLIVLMINSLTFINSCTDYHLTSELEGSNSFDVCVYFDRKMDIVWQTNCHLS